SSGSRLYCQTATIGFSTVNGLSSFAQTTIGITYCVIPSAFRKLDKARAFFCACLLGLFLRDFQMFPARYSQSSPVFLYLPSKFFTSSTHTPGGPTSIRSRSLFFRPGNDIFL